MPDAALQKALFELRSRPHLCLVVAFSAGLLACRQAIVLALLALVGAAALSAAGDRRLAAMAAAALVAGGLAGSARLHAIDAPAAHLRSGQRLAATVELVEAPRPGRFGGWSAEARVITGAARGARLLARSDVNTRLRRGARAAVAGLVIRPRRSPGDSFDYGAYLRRRGIAYALELESLRPLPGRPGGIDTLRRRAEHALAQGVSGERAALAAGMVLGEDERISPELKDDFRRAGLGHLLAVSGQNVVLLGALALPVLAAAGLGIRARAVVLLCLIAVYVPLAGGEPSLQRAGAMGAAGLLALLAGRPASRWYALALAAAATLLVNPRVGGDPGWQLSFAAVTGLLLLGSPLRRVFAPLPHALAEGIGATVAATLATLPLAAFHFGSLPAWSLVANLAALPAVAPAMWLGMVQVALAPFAPDAVQAAIGQATTLALGWIELVARWFSGAPGARLELGLASAPALAGVYAALAAACVGAWRLAHRAEPRLRAGAAEWRRLPRRERRLAAVAAALALVGVVYVATGPARPPRHLTVSFLDIGQGDATLIQDPHGTAVLFDGGPPEARVALKLRRLGVRRLSLMVSTHQSRDHQGGLHEVLQRIPTGLLLENGDGTSDPDYRRLIAEADRRGIRHVAARAGQVLHAGALTIRLLNPKPLPPGAPRPSDPNPRGVAAIVSSGSFDLWLSADAESDAILPLPLRRVEAMKVSHHGSADPGLPQVLRRLRPQIAAIEVGAHNLYGHPRPSTLAALNVAVPHVYRTDRDGTVQLTVEGGKIQVRTHR
ncbi:MAG TPA: ComEC/Rec2 family competence protein [Thermoleophilaceae bacterium]